MFLWFMNQRNGVIKTSRLKALPTGIPAPTASPQDTNFTTKVFRLKMCLEIRIKLQSKNILNYEQD